MKWFSSWWGIEISAENKEDEALLRELVACLPKDANDAYEDGELEIHDRVQKEFERHEGFTLTFSR